MRVQFSPSTNARLAQLVEQRTFNSVVIGSIPIPGIFKLCGGMVYTLDSKSSASAYGFKSHHGHYIRSSSDSLMVKRLAHNELIVGSSPTQRILYALISSFK